MAQTSTIRFSKMLVPKRPRLFPLISACACLLIGAGVAQAAPVAYTLDPSHTFPSFEADHMGISTWRGKVNKSAGKLSLDKATGQGWVEVSIDLTSIDFGLQAMNNWAKGDLFLDTATHPFATFKGQFAQVVNGLPTKVEGELELKGKKRPMVLTIQALKCIPHPLFKRELCGADAYGSFKRDEFGLDAGKDWGFKMDVNLRIQVEALADQ